MKTYKLTDFGRDMIIKHYSKLLGEKSALLDEFLAEQSFYDELCKIARSKNFSSDDNINADNIIKFSKMKKERLKPSMVELQNAVYNLTEIVSEATTYGTLTEDSTLHCTHLLTFGGKIYNNKETE